MLKDKGKKLLNWLLMSLGGYADDVVAAVAADLHNKKILI